MATLCASFVRSEIVILVEHRNERIDRSREATEMRPSRSAASRSALSTSSRMSYSAAVFSDVGMGVGVKGALQIAQVDEAVAVSVVLCECLVTSAFGRARAIQ